MKKSARPFYRVPDLGPGHRGRTFKRLLAEAVALVRRGRIPSVAEVAQSAKVSRATAYRYFPSRSALVTAVIGTSLGPVRSFASDSPDGRARVHELFENTFRSKTRDEWVKAFEGSDACFAPVLSWSEARRDPHNVSRKSNLEVAGVEQPAPAPRFSRTPAAVLRAPPERGEGGAQALAEWGFNKTEIEGLIARGLGTKE